MIDRVAILIASYRRPELLDGLLNSIERQVTSRRVRVVVVDNDPDRSAETVCRDRSVPVDYMVESRPGIVPARNTSLDRLEPNDDAAVFVDDDEFADPDWIERLAATADASGADVVTGPVLPHFTDATPAWLVRGGFWVRPSHPEGAPVERVATNNTLLRLTAWRGSGVRFDPSYNETGGSDVTFFRELAGRGAVVHWTNHAVVHEEVLPERARPGWLARRAMRTGNNRARRLDHPLRCAAEGLARIGSGAALTLVALVRGQGLRAEGFNRFFRGLGQLHYLTGHRVREYRRPGTGATPAAEKSLAARREVPCGPSRSPEWPAEKSRMARVFVVGCPRSGTTLLQSVLGAHPDVFTLPETQFFMRAIGAGPQTRLGLVRPRARAALDRVRDLGLPYVTPRLAGGVPDPRIRSWARAFVTAMDTATVRAGRRAWLEKTPLHLHHVDTIERACPDARFVHIVRDGEATVASLFRVRVDNPYAWKGSPQTRSELLEVCVQRWLADLDRTAACAGRPGQVVVSYSDLVAAGDAAAAALYRAAGLADGPEIAAAGRAEVADRIRLPHETWKASVSAPIGGGAATSGAELTDEERAYVRARIAPAEATLKGLPFLELG